MLLQILLKTFGADLEKLVAPKNLAQNSRLSSITFLSQTRVGI
jgi:hypothetical protein